MKILNIHFKKESERYILASQILSELHRNTSKAKFAIAFPFIEAGEKQNIGYNMQVFFENDELITNKLKTFLKFSKKFSIENIDLKKYMNSEGIIYKRYNGFIRTTHSYVKQTIKNILNNKELKRPFEQKIYEILKVLSSKEPFALSFDEAKKYIVDISCYLKKEYLKMRKYPFLTHYSYTNIRKNNSNPTAIIEIKPEKSIFKGIIELNNFNNFGLAKGQNCIIPLIKDV